MKKFVDIQPEVEWLLSDEYLNKLGELEELKNHYRTFEDLWKITKLAKAKDETCREKETSESAEKNA